MRVITALACIGLVLTNIHCTETEKTFRHYSATDDLIKKMGRIDDSRQDTLRFWQPGVSVQFRFEGDSCEILVGDERLWGHNLNYIQVIVDGESVRTQLTAANDTIRIKPEKKAPFHDVLLVKNTEANIGFMEFYGVNAKSLLPVSDETKRKFEFYGNSITCGASSDTSAIPCGKGKWQDQHNAWLAYGSRLGRKLKADVMLSSVSGIGLMHSCCDLDITMPMVFDKIDMRNGKLNWDFLKYQPDLVFICLGQNDGIQDSAAFVTNYRSFLNKLSSKYPGAGFILLSSPMADDKLRTFFKNTLPSVAQDMAKVKGVYYFETSYIGGCDYHPSVSEHEQIAVELEKWLITANILQ